MKQGLEKRCMEVSVLDIDPLFPNILIPVIVALLSATREDTGFETTMAGADLPHLRLLFNELLHQALTFCILQYDNINASLLKISLAPYECLVLSNYYPSDFVHDACTSAHITW